MDSETKVTGVILAGGLARRMNNKDKGLVLFKDKQLVSYAIAEMNKVVSQTIINANRNILEYQRFGLPVISDQTDSFDGPLAGILAAMQYAQTRSLLVMPCDSPFFKASHLEKLLMAYTQQDVDVAVAHDGKRLHPAFLAITTSLMPDLSAYLQSGQRKLETWLQQQKRVEVDFAVAPEIFSNINTLAELADLEQKMGS